jgi:hypothetical protein
MFRSTSAPAQRIADEVLTWPGVRAAPHRFGGTEFRLGRREIGHVHGDAVADIPFPRRVRDELIAQRRAEAHHWLPDSGWVTLRLAGDGAAGAAIELLRMSYDRAVAASARRARRAGAPVGRVD